MDIKSRIIAIARANGADLAGIADPGVLRRSPSHLVYPLLDDYQGVGTVNDGTAIPPERLFDWPAAARAVLVIALSHPRKQPELDWWDGNGGPPATGD
ncbi:MAG: hypothetical protein JW781_05905 [Deltaproteobacteria bacterium]|nr:hypothetical protein [Candidatus Anaeroferrophillacea bacterium]